MQETRLIQNIIPYDRNPRNNKLAVDHILESLRKHGQVKPIVISSVGHPFEQETVCCGHTTLEALVKFGATEVKVIVHEFRDESEFVDYNIRDNKTSEFADWDNMKLTDLGVDFDIDLKDMGFDLDVPDFGEGNEDEQGQLDEIDPKIIQCPHCEKTFEQQK